MNIIVIACRPNKIREYQELASLIPNGITRFVNSDVPNKDFRSFVLFIREKCVEAYMFIVKHFTTPNTIWLFGDAIIIQNILGMIACGGILKYDPDSEWDEDDLKDRCEEVYSIHQTPLDEYQPNGGYSIVFRLGNSHCTNQPVVRFVGLVEEDMRSYRLTYRIIMCFKLLFSKKCLKEYEFQENDGSHVVKTICQVFWKYCMSDDKKWRRRTCDITNWVKKRLMEEIG